MSKLPPTFCETLASQVRFSWLNTKTVKRSPRAKCQNWHYKTNATAAICFFARHYPLTKPFLVCKTSSLVALVKSMLFFFFVHGQGDGIYNSTSTLQDLQHLSHLGIRYHPSWRSASYKTLVPSHITFNAIVICKHWYQHQESKRVGEVKTILLAAVVSQSETTVQ